MPRRAPGFTLIELMIAIAILAIFTVMASPIYNRIIANQRLRSGSTALYLALVKTRNEAIRRGDDVTLTSASGGWQNGWTMAYGTTNIEVEGQQAGVSVTPSPSSLTTVTYQSSGRISTTPPQFLFTSSVASAPNYCVSVSPSGLPYSTSGQITTC